MHKYFLFGACLWFGGYGSCIAGFGGLVVLLAMPLCVGGYWLIVCCLMLAASMVNSVVVVLFFLMNLSCLLKLVCFDVDCNV